MSTKIYIQFARKNVILDKVENEAQYFHKKASLETLTKEANERRYTSKKNVCNKCFIVMSVKTKECNCN